MTAGEPSYAELTRRVVEQRLAEGAEEHAARIAKSSVHDAFRLGRSRVNLPLTRELVRVLGGDPSDVDAGSSRPEVEGPSRARRVQPEPPEQQRPEPDGTADQVPVAASKHVLVLMTACLGLNLLGRAFVDFFAFPIYLDMIGTAIAAIALGPWRGAAVGLSTNVVAALPERLDLAARSPWSTSREPSCGATACVGGAWAGPSPASSCSTYARRGVLGVAVPILLTLVADRLREGHDAITRLVEEPLGSLELAVAFSNVLTSSADKLISGFVALVVVSALPWPCAGTSRWCSPASRSRTGTAPAAAMSRTGWAEGQTLGSDADRDHSWPDVGAEHGAELAAPHLSSGQVVRQS